MGLLEQTLLRVNLFKFRVAVEKLAFYNLMFHSSGQARSIAPIFLSAKDAAEGLVMAKLAKRTTPTVSTPILLSIAPQDARA